MSGFFFHSRFCSVRPSFGVSAIPRESESIQWERVRFIGWCVLFVWAGLPFGLFKGSARVTCSGTIYTTWTLSFPFGLFTLSTFNFSVPGRRLSRASSGADTCMRSNYSVPFGLCTHLIFVFSYGLRVTNGRSRATFDGCTCVRALTESLAGQFP